MSQQEKSRNKLIQPYQVLIFNLAVFVCLVGIMFVFPKEGLTLTENTTLYFPVMEDFFTADTAKKDIKEILETLETPDTLKVKNKRDSLQRIAKKIQYPNGDKSVLYPAFEYMEKAKEEKRPIHVMHYGDSQIEGDRMSSLFRSRLQDKFGGSGPGLLAAKPLVKSFSVIQDYSESMERYTCYGNRDSTVTHKRYGAMAIFSRFCPYFPDSLIKDSVMRSGWFSYQKSRNAYRKAREYTCMKLYYSRNRTPFTIRVTVDGEVLRADTFPATTRLNVVRWNFEKTPEKILVEMAGIDSPEIYGVSLEGENGIEVDNISMRGSSGTLFGGLDYGILKPMYDSLNIKLCLLQYGGNTVPYIKDEKGAERYGRDLKRQIDYLRGLLPDACFVMIGPADMSTKVKGVMQTYPLLPAVRDALKKAAFDAGAAYFDIYEVMGGKNSMIEWVNAKPPLAGSDFVHFNQTGAKKIADVFINSLMDDYAEFTQLRKKGLIKPKDSSTGKSNKGGTGKKDVSGKNKKKGK